MITTYSGMLKKMRTSADESNTVHYSLPIGDELVDINSLIGKEVTVTYSGEINCVHCNRKTKKSFNQGYCYPCLISLAQCDSCIIKPEKCHYHEGTCREPQWGEEHCLSEHFVYLANTGTVKVGITRQVTEGVSTRWMDQGATQATVMLRVPDRLTSGLVETLCKDHIADKTNWRTMLKGKPDEVDLEQVKTELMGKIESELEALKQEKGLQAVSEVTTPIHDIHYPVEDYPVKIKSLNLDKTPSFTGVLQGIKGQYWMLDGDRVINIRKFAGYNVDLSF
ncbi:DUF2797 domain-containing protein [Alteromonas macleodii]|uniref:DUF2797 domain-containing protein n=1 Tax=Alteromonas macleodii TaxID=28108 RepID=UPI0001AEC3B9|nr:DUF2797 domain-containing protein [Alteromonas macleodii]AFS37245.1 hypothetical protein MASE_08570 [Alteromonas macleodii ATCC 27126]